MKCGFLGIDGSGGVLWRGPDGATFAGAAVAAGGVRWSEQKEQGMNRVFRIVWSYVLQAWVVASELSMRRGKRGGMVDQRTVTVEDRHDGDTAGIFRHTAWPLRLGVLLALDSQTG